MLVVSYQIECSYLPQYRTTHLRYLFSAKGLRRLKNGLRQAGINRTSSSIEGIIDTQNNITNQTTTEKFGTILNILNDTNASKG